MKRINILTYWGVANYGAWTQAYALNNVLRQLTGQEGVAVEHLDYLEQSHYNMYYKTDERLHNSFTYSWDIIPHTEHLDEYQIEEKNFDILVTGADSIWTLKNIPGNADFHLAGYNLNAKKMIAYAPSSGIYTAEDGLIKEMEIGLRQYDAISVRDETTADMVERLIGKRPEIVLDPALLWDFSSDPMILKPTYKEYIVVYGYRWEQQFIDEAVAFAKKKKLKLISVGFVNEWCDMSLRMLELRGPEWIGMFSNAEYVVTSTFHGLMVGLSYRKQIMYCQNDFTKNRSSTLLEELGIVDEGASGVEINYESVSGKLDKLTKKSIDWLEKSLVNS